MAETPEQLFGQMLRALRRERHLSQEELGFESGYHRTYISDLERGKYSPSLIAILRLSRALDVLPSELLRRIEREVTEIPERPTERNPLG